MAYGLAHLKDEFGNDFYLCQAGDVFMPASPVVSDFREQLRHVRQMELNPDDVILSAFPKSGTHWVQEIIYMLITGTTDYDKHDLDWKIDFFRQEPASSESRSPPRVYTSHHRFHLLPKQVSEKGVMVVHLRRNPKDVWVSLYNHTHSNKGTLHYGGTWDQFFKLLMSLGYWYGDWFDYELDWEQVIANHQAQVPFHTLAYEDLKKDLVGEIEKLDEFLGCKRGREFHNLVSEACSFQNLKQEKEQTYPEHLRDQVWQDNTVSLYRKGEVGDWKNWFTVAQNELFDEVYKQRMAGSKLRFTFVQ